MTGRPEPLPIEALLAQEHALRSLARRLLWDEHDAEDATQHSLVQAIERPPARRQSLAAYLAAILRNRVRDLGRVARARRHREQQAARDEALPSAGEMAEREQTRRALAEAVLGLEEPYRTTVWLRFYEDLPPRELARRMDVPVNTVRTRLHRAVLQLRAILDQRHGGDRDAWRAAIAPLTGWPAQVLSAPGAVLGGVVMKKSLVVAAAVVLVASVALWLQLFASGGSRPQDPAVGVAAERGREATDPPTRPVEPQAATRVPAPPPLPAAASSAWRIEGLVRDAAGTPVPRARIAVAATGYSHREDCGRAACDQDGRYAVDLSAWRERPALDLRVLGLEVKAWAPGHLPAFAERVAFAPAAPDQEMVLRSDVNLLAGALLTGRVVDPAGAGVADASVRLSLAADEENGAETRTGPDGTYVLGIGRSGAHVLVASRADVGWSREDRLVLRTGHDLTAPDLVLAAVASLRGQFVYDDGQPIADLDVSAHWQPDDQGSQAESQPTARRERGSRSAEGRTGADGRFEFRCLAPGRYRVPLPGGWTSGDEFRVLATGPDEHRLETAQHRFRVRHEDERGRRLIPLPLGIRGWLPRPGTTAPQPDTAQPELNQAGFFDDLFVPHGTRACFTAEGGTYRGETRAVAPVRPNETEVVVTLREPRLTARLRIELVPRPGTRAPEFAIALCKPSGTDARVELLNVRSSERHEVLGLVPAPAGTSNTVLRNEAEGTRVFRAEPGRFQLEVQPGPEDRLRNHWFPITREVVLVEDQELLVRADAVAGGYVRFTVHLPGRETVRKIPGFKVTAPHPGDAAPRGSGTFTVHNAAEGSWLSMGHAPSEAPFRWDRLLEPGPHVLTVIGSGFRTTTLPVVIRAGELTDVEVWLVP